MSCMVSTIKWYHEMENGTEHLIKVTKTTLCAIYPATFKVIEQSMSVVPISIIIKS